MLAAGLSIGMGLFFALAFLALLACMLWWANDERDR
jgi:hypothetical protein